MDGEARSQPAKSTPRGPERHTGGGSGQTVARKSFIKLKPFVQLMDNYASKHENLQERTKAGAIEHAWRSIFVEQPTDKLCARAVAPARGRKRRWSGKAATES